MQFSLLNVFTLLESMLQTFQIVSHDIVENLNWGTKTLVITKTCLILSIIKEKLFLLVSNYDKLKVVSFLLTSLNRSNDMHLRKIIFCQMDLLFLKEKCQFLIWSICFKNAAEECESFIKN